DGLGREVLSRAVRKLPLAVWMALDYRIVRVAVDLAMVTPLAFGIVPAIRAARATIGDGLKETTRTPASGRRPLSLLGLLVVGQFAVALVLSVGAGLLVRSFVRLVQTDPGFRPAQTVRATMTLPIGRY